MVHRWVYRLQWVWVTLEKGVEIVLELLLFQEMILGKRKKMILQISLITSLYRTITSSHLIFLNLFRYSFNTRKKNLIS